MNLNARSPHLLTDQQVAAVAQSHGLQLLHPGWRHVQTKDGDVLHNERGEKYLLTCALSRKAGLRVQVHTAAQDCRIAMQLLQ